MRRQTIPIIVTALLLGLSLAAPADATTPALSAPEAGHSAVWYDADNPGTGWVLEMLNGRRAAAYWYGFDEAGQPVWWVGAGGVEGTPLRGLYLAFHDLYSARGARFGDAFDPADVALMRVGAARMTFFDCDSGVVTVEPEDEERSDVMDRLTRTMGAGCEAGNGKPAYPVKPYAGQSGTWYDPTRSGEGLTLQWMDRDEAVLYWFTYDPEGNPLWLFGVGADVDGDIVFPQLYSAFRDADGEVQLTDWGSLALDLGCTSGILSWASILPGFGEGSRELTRLNTLVSPVCPVVMSR